MKQKTHSWVIGLCVVLLLIASGCEIAIDKIPKASENQELKKFSSEKELKDYLKEAQQYHSFVGALDAEALLETASIASPKAAQTAGGFAADYSTTNVQVAGVDEADFVKNDNKYIYVLSGNKLVIADAYPAESAKILSTTELKLNPRNMLVNKDRLVIFADGDYAKYVISDYDFIPRPVFVSRTHALVYDISERENPKLVKNYSISGYYLESRMIDGYIYFIASSAIYSYYGDVITMPVVKESSRIIAKPDIYYFDNIENSYNFNTVASFNLFEEDEINAKTFMMGNSNTIYVSKDALYFAHQKNLPFRQGNEERFYKVILPLLPLNFQTEIQRTRDNAALSSSEKWEKIADVLEDMYNSMEENEKKELIGKIEKEIEEYELKQEQERRKTAIYKIMINKGNFEYKGKAEVPGYLLNQFSIDEFNDNLRVATTTYIYGRENVMYNNVYVLDNDLSITGKLENIARDERIYSTRFIGEKLYMVTFKRIDPLFVIDLSNPENPEVLGELKIPGYSDYLHPYDESHIIGIGKETEGNEFGGVSVKGVKIALFDVSDVASPKLVDSYEIGGQGTDSEALRDHKAFLFSREKGIMVIPVTEVKEKSYYDEKLGYYRQKLWQGAYSFSITPENGIKVKGKITHSEGEEERYYYWNNEKAVRRALFMDDVLYTVSSGKIKMNELNNPENEINELELPYEKKYYDEIRPLPMEGTVTAQIIS